jgi:hypothetical protein
VEGQEHAQEETFLPRAQGSSWYMLHEGAQGGDGGCCGFPILPLRRLHPSIDVVENATKQKTWGSPVREDS